VSTELPPFDGDLLTAHIDVLGRMGCSGFEIGYVHDDVPVEQAGWYAHVNYQGMRQIEADHPGPLQAAEALARRLLDKGGCKCAARITLDPTDADVPDRCYWQIVNGRRWESSCDAPSMLVKGAKRGDVNAMTAAFTERAAVVARGGNRAERRRRRKKR
jgi:hypothetical protein